jgi:hypothetical protein
LHFERKSKKTSTITAAIFCCTKKLKVGYVRHYALIAGDIIFKKIRK